MRKFRDLIGGEGVYVFDGAVGTRLYDMGIYINRSYDEINLTVARPRQRGSRRIYAAGADIIETNTFGATRPKLLPYGLESKLHEINVAAVRIAG
ncbi:MAG: homocysteine S-methyltransferase family protein [Pyrinomonadaceae bacterium]